MKLNTASTGLGIHDFRNFLKSLFDDSEEIDFSYAKHSECHVTLLANVDEDWAEALHLRYELPFDADKLVGHWLIEGTSDYTWGFNWDYVDEAVKVTQVTRTVTKTVTEWKPICDETVSPCSKE